MKRYWKAAQLVLVLLLAAGACSRLPPDGPRPAPGTLGPPRITRTASPTPPLQTETPGPSQTPTGTQVPQATPTWTQTQEPGPVASPTPTLQPPTWTPTAGVPGSGVNLLLDGDYPVPASPYWNSYYGYWHEHIPITQCGDYFGYYAQMDRDERGSDVWPPPPSEDVLYQDAGAPMPHSLVTVAWVEAHHMRSLPDYINVVLLGQKDIGEPWEELASWPAAQGTYGSGKCNLWGLPPEHFTHQLAVETPYPFYRLELRGGLLRVPYNGSGVLLGGLWLSVE